MSFFELPVANQPSMALAPVNLAAAAANTIYANLRDVNTYLAIFFYLGAGGAAEDVTVGLQQATSSAGAGAKALTVKNISYKRGATSFTAANAAARDKFAVGTNNGVAVSREAPAASWNTLADRVAVTNEFMGCILVNPKDLDLANGFIYVRATFTDPGATAQLGFAWFDGLDKAYDGASSASILV